MKITKVRLNQIIKEELLQVLNESYAGSQLPSRLTDEERAQFKAEIEKAWPYMRANLYGSPEAKRGSEGLFNDWSNGSVLDLQTAMLRFGPPVEATKNVLGVLRSWRGPEDNPRDINILKAAEWIGKMLSIIEETKAEIKRIWASGGSRPTREFAAGARKSINDVQTINGGFAGQLYGYAHSALTRNDLMTPSKRQFD